MSYRLHCSSAAELLFDTNLGHSLLSLTNLTVSVFAWDVQEKRNEDLFLALIKHPQCKVVVCARLAPKQKANVVDLVKVPHVFNAPLYS